MKGERKITLTGTLQAIDLATQMIQTVITTAALQAAAQQASQQSHSLGT